MSTVKTPDILRSRRQTALHTVTRIVLTLVLVGLMVRLVIPLFSDWEAIVETFEAVSGAEVVFLLVLLAVSEVLKAAVPTVLVDRLPLRRSFVADEASNAVSNVIPGPSGTATRYLIYRSWGLDIEQFGKATVVNSLLNNGMQLVMPLLSLLAISVHSGIPARGWLIAGASFAVAAIASTLLYFVIRSEAFARRFGTLLGGVVTWARGMFNRPPASDIGEALARFRLDTVESVRDRWLRLTAVIVAKYVVLFAIMWVSVLAVGVPRSVLPFGLAFAAYAAARVLTMIEITPGGVGVNEIVYISLLSYVTGPDYHARVAAGVLLFRGLTYVGPLLIGAVCYVIWCVNKSWRVESAPSIANV